MRRLALRLALGLLLAAGPALPQTGQEAPQEPPGPLVTAVEIRSDAPLNEDIELEELLETEVGQPLSEEDVRHTLRNLQASGTASEIEVYTREDPEAGGVVVVIVFRAVVQVEEVRIAGRLGLPLEELRRAIPQRNGEPLSEEQVLRGVYALKEVYERSGYFHSTARVAVATDERRRQAVVTYTVDSGPRATVETIAFSQAVDPFAPAALVKQLRLKPGEPYSRRLAREDAERLQSWLIDQRHGAALVDPPEEEYDPATNSVKLTYPIEVGPEIVVEVRGADEETLRRKGLLPFLGESGYDEALLLQAAGRIKTEYQRQGHYDVRVDTDERRTDGRLVVGITVEPGPVYTLTSIELEGNEEIPEKELRDLMLTSERSLLRRGSGRLVQAELDEDVENLARYYALKGYANAEVGPPQVEWEGDELHLVIPIREGSRQRVASLSFEGVENLADALERIRENLALQEAGGFHPVLLDRTLETVRAEYAAQGYTQAQISARQDWNPDHTLVDVVIQILEGPRQVADRIIVRGNQRTLADVIRRTLGLKKGDPISDVKLLEVERNLYRLGIFSRVDVELVPAGLETEDRDVVVRVEEGKQRALTYGVGLEVEAPQSGSAEYNPRGLIGFTNNNLAGRAYSLRTELRLSERDKFFRLLFNQPYLGERPVSLTSTLFYEDEFPPNESFEEVVRYGARIEAVRVFSSRRVSLGLDFRQVELEGVDPGLSANEIERENQPYELTSLISSFFWDRRDDPLATTRGWSTLAQLQYAFPALRTDTEFLRLFVQQTQYFDLGRPGVIAASVRAGGIEPLTTLAPVPGDPLAEFPSRNIPLPERFFAGGDSSHRAYGRDDLGIRGETLLLSEDGDEFLPVGGDGVFLLNLDYRFPIFGDFGGTIFFDSGNVWADWRSIDFGELRNGVGIGVRYLSPIGPLRAGIGWKLDRERGEPAEPTYELFFNIGNPF
ncbi:MAG TPA: outer membrane protein assembly factor BamA [Thermoanaerobaculia bacterium]